MNIRDWVGAINWSWKGVPKSLCRGEKIVKVGRGMTKRNNKFIRTEVLKRHRWRRRVQTWRENWGRNPLLNLKKVRSFDWTQWCCRVCSLREKRRSAYEVDQDFWIILSAKYWTDSMEDEREAAWRVPDGRPVLEDRTDYDGVKGEESFWRGEGVELTI